MKAGLAPCGTYGAYKRHLRRDEKPCRPCRDAAMHYQRQFRRANPDAYARELASTAARGRALERLASEYPRRFLELVNEERAAVHATEAKP